MADKTMTMDKAGRSFVMIMVAIAVTALLLRVVIIRIVSINIAQNESAASLTLKLISTALENYAKDNNGQYPASFSVLVKSSPSYLDIDYLERSPVKGYYYSCQRLEASGYSCYANPAKCRLSGNAVYNISTAGLMVSEDCSGSD
jgi:hypothetical protein